MNVKTHTLARFLRVACLAGALIVGPAGPAAKAQEAAPPSLGTQAGPVPVTVDDLAHRQSTIADKYSELEEKLFKLADLEASSNPRRAALLKEAYKQSKDRLTKTQLAKVVALMSENSLKRAVDGQTTVATDMRALLELLLSENRRERVTNEAQRIKEMIQEVKRIRRQQQANRGRTEGGADMEELAKIQGQIADRTNKVGKQLEDLEPKDGRSKDGEPKDGEPKDGQPKDGQSKDGQPKDGQPKDGQPKDGESKDGESKDGEPKDGQPKDGESKDGQPKDGESKDGESKDGESKDGQSKDGESKDGESKDGEPKDGESKDGQSKDGESKDTPGQQGQQGENSDSEQADGQGSPPGAQEPSSTRKRIQAAEERMREAKRKLEEAKREESVEEQRKAEQEIDKAIAELEEILRQLREEEVERVLALLEGRFRKMLEMQLKVYEDTIGLAKIEGKRRDDVAIRANKLSVSEQKIVLEADRSLTLLLEEASSVAFPETVQQMRDDMQQVVDRLGQSRVDRITQAIEEDIVQTLEELIEALQQAQKDLEKKKQPQQQQPPPGEQPDQPLVDAIAELKMIRALQMRINTRTKRYARLLDNEDDPAGQATDADLQGKLAELGQREERVQKITRDIVLGKNK